MNDPDDWRQLLKQKGFQEKEQDKAFIEHAISIFLHQHQQQLTPIQKAAIDPIYQGDDSLLISSTASGKTEAVAIPVAARLTEDRRNSLCVYIAPTKALLNDLEKRLRVSLHRLGLSLGIRHGDKPLSSTDQELHFLLTTPESLDILLCKDYPILSKTKHVVCDEIHQIYGSPRGLQLLFLLKRLEKKAGRRIQRIALSATIGNHERLVKWFEGDSSPVRVFSIPSDRTFDAEIFSLTRETTLKHVIERTTAKKILIFANSRRKCDDLFLELQDLVPYRVFAHYSSLEKEQREYVESHFRVSEFAICIATTTLELGIDVGSIESIILYEPPQSVGSYLQRIGRGSRRADKTWVIMTPKTTLELLRFCALTTLASEGNLEDLPAGEFYSVLIQQTFASIASKHHHRVHRSEIEELTRFLPWVQQEETDSILQRLSDQRFLRYEAGWNSYQMGPNLENLYNDTAIFSNITNGDSGVQVFHGGRRLAVLPVPLHQLKIGSTLLFAGRYWVTTSMGEGRISVRPAGPTANPIRPSYRRGFGNAIDRIVSQRIKNILKGKIDLSIIAFDRESKTHLHEILDGARSKEKEDFIPMAMDKSGYIYYTFAGSQENRLLHLLLTEFGYSCQLVKECEDLMILGETELDFDSLPAAAEVVQAILSKHWTVFEPFASKGPFYKLLPMSLRRKEVLSQIDHEAVISHVIDMRNTSPQAIHKPLFWKV